MEFAEYFPIWDKLTPSEKERLSRGAVLRQVKKGALLHNGSMDCLGLLLVREGQLRAYIYSDTGREVTIYRLFERDICLFSASCIMQSIQFDITIEAEKNSLIWVIPPELYKDVMEQSAPLANYTSQIMASRFTDVMWLVEQIMWKSLDQRLAAFLLEESSLEDSPVLRLTHEKIASHMGTAREVITRMLRYFQEEGMVSLSRGTITIQDPERLARLQD